MINKALIDNDFLVKLTEIKGTTQEVVSLISRAFNDANLEVRMHELVYINEFGLIALKEPAKSIFEECVIGKLLMSDIFADSNKKKYYEFCVKELYFRKNQQFFPFDDITVWKRKANLGEIHSVSACLTCSYGLFLSDDNDSKELNRIVRETHLGESIRIYDREEFINNMIKSGSLNSKEKHKFKHKK
ncbi:MAG: hypothetical protein IJS85_04265 [Clostridiales bacterium]|nr:hypothetical protein [Clostridiales bacterium]